MAAYPARVDIDRYPTRKLMRLPSFDYRTGGAYFVTIVTADRAPLFGAVTDGTMEPSPLGEIAVARWLHMGEARRDHVTLDAFVLMPNHIHGVLFIDVGVTPSDRGRRFSEPQARSLSTIVGGYKGAVSREASVGSSVWQRGFYDHLIRSDNDLARVRRYIAENPAKWDRDEHFVPATLSP